MKNRRDIIENLTPKDLTKAVYLSQLLFFSISIILSVFFIRDVNILKGFFQWNDPAIFYYGVMLAVVLIIVEILLYNTVPRKHFDDGGINEKLFKNQSVVGIFFIALTIATVEEFLFRGVIQTVFGYFFASSLFVVLHTRYLRKPVLLLLLIITSFLIGYLFKITNNLLVVIAFHFIVDFILGLYIKFSK